jgi:hypothetical protein
VHRPVCVSGGLTGLVFLPLAAFGGVPLLLAALLARQQRGGAGEGSQVLRFGAGGQGDVGKFERFLGCVLWRFSWGFAFLSQGLFGVAGGAVQGVGAAS